MVAAQERVRLISASASDVDQLIRILRQREDEGEGSRYDRIRAEREVAELRTDVVAASALVAAARGKINGFLPKGPRCRACRDRCWFLSRCRMLKLCDLAPSTRGPTIV